MSWNRICVCTLGAFLLGGSGAACSSGVGPGAGGAGGPSAPGPNASGPTSTGSVGLGLSLPGGITIDQVSYVITGPTPESNTVDVSLANSAASFVVGGLTVGTGYTITLSASDTAGDPCTSTPTSFSIGFEQTTPLMLALVCTVGDGGYVFPDSGAGSVQVGASVTTFNNPTTVCPVIASLSIPTAEAMVGTPMDVSVTTNPSGATVSYAMVDANDGGSASATLVATMTGATVTCTAPGQVLLTATTTAPLANDAGSCPPQSASAVLTCEPSPANDP
jgi:hypothetical protein